ncbi:MAG TPA: PAS domain-containing protein [Methanomicrobiales archaeon]|jgi:PAS domain-containing protein|nr:PAS domain-containing protein [Methanomicrobiales archaeon]
MDHEQVEQRIKSLLKQHRRGLTITDLSLRLKMNRNAVVKYLEVLETKGEIESYRFGNAKVFALAHRLPISALFHLAMSPVCIIDERCILTFANRSFYSFFGSSEQDALHQSLEEISFDDAVTPNPGAILKDPPEGREETRECTFAREGADHCFRIRMLPVTFGDGSQGTTCLFDDVTREKRYLKNLEFLARTSAVLAEMGDDEDMYQYIADRVAELEPRAHVNVNSIDPETRICSVRAISSADPRFLRDFMEAVVPLGDLRAIPMDMNNIPASIDALSAGSLFEGPGSLYELAFRSLPEPICKEIDEKVRLERNYVMGCTCRGGLFGAVVLRLRRGDMLENMATVQAFVKQAGVALQRKHLREKLRRIEDKEGKSAEKITIPLP